MALVRLLVVDDFRLWRDCLKEHLEGHPDLHIAGFASDGLEALQKPKKYNLIWFFWTSAFRS